MCTCHILQCTRHAKAKAMFLFWTLQAQHCPTHTIHYTCYPHQSIPVCFVVEGFFVEACPDCICSGILVIVVVVAGEWRLWCDGMFVSCLESSTHLSSLLSYVRWEAGQSDTSSAVSGKPLSDLSALTIL